MSRLVLLILLLPNCLLAQVPFFEGDFEDFKEKAQVEHRVYFIDLYTSWCGYCKKMDATTFQNQELGDYVATKFLALKLNAEQMPGKELAIKYGVKGYPTVLVFNHKGELVDKIVGYKDAANFKLALEKHESKSDVKQVDSKLVQQYFDFQRADMHRLEENIMNNPLDEFSQFKQAAIKLGVSNNRFEFEELQFDLEQKYGEKKSKEMELYYQLGKGDEDGMTVEINELRKQGFISRDLLAYFIRYFSVDAKPTIEQLRWVNELLLVEKTEELMELKAFVQLRFGDIEDAKLTLKELQKMMNKKHSLRTDLLHDLMIE